MHIVSRLDVTSQDGHWTVIRTPVSHATLKLQSRNSACSCAYVSADSGSDLVEAPVCWFKWNSALAAVPGSTVVPQIGATSMKAHDAQKDIRIVSASSHCFDEVNVHLLCTLAASHAASVVRVAPHNESLMITRTLCKMTWALSKFQPPFSPHLSGWLLFNSSRRSTALWWSKAYRLLRPDATQTTQHVPLQTQDQLLISTSLISSLGSVTWSRR